jgi:signal transduction histidine kinase/ligand-binding sensor domain-containing protein
MFRLILPTMIALTFLSLSVLFSQTVHIPNFEWYKKPSGLDPKRKITQYVSTIWQAQQGLPQNSALALCQTRDGYLWIGTEEGAARFDGLQFKIFDKDIIPGLSVGYIISFYEQRDGTLWMGTRGGGLVRRAYGQTGEYTLFDSTKGLPAVDIWAIVEDRAGTLWIGTENGLFAYTDGHFQHFTTRDGLPHSIVYSVHQDRMGTLWVGTQKGLCRLNGSPMSHAPQEKIFVRENLLNDTSEIHAILHDSKGTLRVGSRNGLWSRPSGGVWRLLTQKDGLSGHYVYHIVEDRNGSIWLAMFDNGISRIVGNQIEAFDRKDGLANENTLALLEDREGAMWVGTDGGGVQRFTNGSCINMTTREGLAGNVVRSFCEDSTGGIWIATSSTGLHCLRNGKITLYDKTKTHVFAGNEIRALFTAPDGTVWVGILGVGVYYYKGGRWGHYSTKDGLVSDDVNIIVRDREGALWFGCSNNGISRFKNGRFTSLDMQDGLTNESVYGLLPDSAGGIWIGSFGGGAQYYRNGKFTNYTVANGLMGNSVLGFYQDAVGAVWVAGVGGISRIKNGTVRSFTKKEGLYDEAAFTLLEDDYGYLWATSNKGVYRFRKSEADSVADGFLKAMTCQNFGTINGMRSAECNGGAQPSALKAHDGRLWFSTIEGAVIIDPLHIETNPLPPPVIIEKVLVNLQPLNLAESAVIPPDNTDLEFHYSAPNLIGADHVRFRFLLEGFDREWTGANSRRIAYYTNLPRGHSYRFRVQACNNDGVWNNVGGAYSFTLQPYFYETWWFIVLCGMSTLAIAMTVYQVRVRQITMQAHTLELLVQERTQRLQQSNEELAAANAEVQRQIALSDMQAREIEFANAQFQESNERLRQLDAEKNEFLGVAAHDLKNPLSSIIMTISMMQRYNEKIDARERSTYLQRIEATAERMLAIVTDLLNINEMESGELRLHFEPLNLAEIAADAAQHYQIIAQRKNIRFVSNFPDEALMVMADKEKLWEILENLLSNAIKFSPTGKHIYITVSEASTMACLEIKDEGPGLSEEDKSKVFHKFARLSAQPTGGEHSTGLGLSIVKKMAEAMSGTVHCESELGKGARFIVKLPKI